MYIKAHSGQKRVLLVCIDVRGNGLLSFWFSMHHDRSHFFTNWNQSTGIILFRSASANPIPSMASVHRAADIAAIRGTG